MESTLRIVHVCSLPSSQISLGNICWRPQNLSSLGKYWQLETHQQTRHITMFSQAYIHSDTGLGIGLSSACHVQMHTEFKSSLICSVLLFRQSSHLNSIHTLYTCWRYSASHLVQLYRRPWYYRDTDLVFHCSRAIFTTIRAILNLKLPTIWISEGFAGVASPVSINEGWVLNHLLFY